MSSLLREVYRRRGEGRSPADLEAYMARIVREGINGVYDFVTGKNRGEDKN